MAVTFFLSLTPNETCRHRIYLFIYQRILAVRIYFIPQSLKGTDYLK